MLMTGILSRSAHQLPRGAARVTSNPDRQTTLPSHGCQTIVHRRDGGRIVFEDTPANLLAPARTAPASTSVPTSASDLSEQFGFGK
jgi:hypothetical protein